MQSEGDPPIRDERPITYAVYAGMLAFMVVLLPLGFLRALGIGVIAGLCNYGARLVRKEDPRR